MENMVPVRKKIVNMYQEKLFWLMIDIFIINVALFHESPYSMLNAQPINTKK